jgi:hypothetical protein
MTFKKKIGRNSEGVWTAKRRHLGRVGGAKRPSGRNKDLHAAL